MSIWAYRAALAQKHFSSRSVTEPTSGCALLGSVPRGTLGYVLIGSINPGNVTGQRPTICNKTVNVSRKLS